MNLRLNAYATAHLSLLFAKTHVMKSTHALSIVARKWPSAFFTARVNKSARMDVPAVQAHSVNACPVAKCLVMPIVRNGIVQQFKPESSI